MTFSDTVKRCLSLILIILLAVTVTGCEDFGFPPPQPSEPEEKTEVEVPPIAPVAVRSGDRATQVVYEYLLSQAESYQAKDYLAEFYTTCDNWTAETELFKDGTSIWYVAVDMTTIETWEGLPYWQQAGWLVFQDGKVVPSNRLKANALKIEADLQELSLQPKPLVTEETEESNGE